ncbi:hypothetical protein Tco_0664310 [Tanacetum coccineum]
MVRDVNPFGGGNPGFHDDHYDNPLLTKETESEPIIWDIWDEEEEYPFVNKYPSFQEELIVLVEEESCPVYDTYNEQEESMPVYDTDIEDVIEEEEGFVGIGGFDGEEDNIEDVLDTAYGSIVIRHIGNWSNALSYEVQALIRLIFLFGYGEIESEPIIWDIGDEEEEYPFVNKYPSFQEEPIVLMEEESCPVTPIMKKKNRMAGLAEVDKEVVVVAKEVAEVAKEVVEVAKEVAEVDKEVVEMTKKVIRVVKEVVKVMERMEVVVESLNLLLSSLSSCKTHYPLLFAETRGVTSWISSQHNGVNNRETLKCITKS